MLTFINLLIIFFLVLIIYQLFLANKIIEGLTNDENDPLILSKENTANINVLTKRVDKLDGTNQQITDLSNNLTILQARVDDMDVSLKDMANQMPGVKPVDGEDDTENQ
jgi:hypothetical protein